MLQLFKENLALIDQILVSSNAKVSTLSRAIARANRRYRRLYKAAENSGLWDDYNEAESLRLRYDEIFWWL